MCSPCISCLAYALPSLRTVSVIIGNAISTFLYSSGKAFLILVCDFFNSTLKKDALLASLFFRIQKTNEQPSLYVSDRDMW